MEQRWHTKGKGVSMSAITPNDSGNIMFDSLFVGTGGGNIKVLLKDDTTPIVLKNIGNGEFLPIAVKRVYSTDTTVADILGIITGCE